MKAEVVTGEVAVDDAVGTDDVGEVSRRPVLREEVVVRLQRSVQLERARLGQRRTERRHLVECNLNVIAATVRQRADEMRSARDLVPRRRRSGRIDPMRLLRALQLCERSLL